jgi:hypothetical protein
MDINISIDGLNVDLMFVLVYILGFETKPKEIRFIIMIKWIISNFELNQPINKDKKEVGNTFVLHEYCLK